MGRKVGIKQLLVLNFFTSYMSTEQINNQSNPTGNGGEGSDFSNLPLKDALSKALGKEFPDDSTAIKAVKDTFDFVGKAGKSQKIVQSVMESQKLDEESAIRFINEKLTTNPPAPQPKTEDFVSRKEFEESQFYSEHQELKPYKNLLETFVKANPGKSRTEILEMPDFKDSFGKIQEQDAIGKQKSILHSNHGVGKGADKMTQAKDAQKSGDQQTAEKNAVESVMESFQL
jgi:hypothetical protein